MRPSLLLRWDGFRVLLDTSTDLRQQALAHGIDRVDAVLYTHAHADHVLGLDELRLYNWRQGGAIPVYGSADTLEALSRTFWYAFTRDRAGGGKPAVDRRPVTEPFDLFSRRVTPVPLLHGRLPILGYRTGGFACLTDVSRIPDASYPLLRDLDVLVISALRPRPHPTHLSLAEAVDEAARIGARRTFLTHLGHEMPYREISATLPAGVELAYDGLVLDVAEEPS